MPLTIVENGLSPEENYEVLDVTLTEVLDAAGVNYDDEEFMRRLISYDRQLRIALGVPVEVDN